MLDAFLQAGGAIYAQRAGKISCIQRASIRASIVTISATDTAGPLEIDTAASRIDRINTIRPRFWSEAHRWQLTAIDEVTAAAYQTEDGAKRTRGIDYPYVTNARQSAQLAALQIANTREGIAGVIPLKPHLQRIRPGDAFTITEPGFVLNGVKCLCLNTDYDPATGVVRVSFVSETDAKYAFAMGQNPTPPAPPVLTPVDPTYVTPPQIGDWTIVVRPPSPGGGQLPGFDLGGIVSNDTATAIIVEHGPSAAGPWTQAYQGPPTVTNIPIDGLQPGATYYVAIQYQRNQNYSARQVYGPYTAPLLDPSPTAPTIAALNAELAALEALQASETVIREEQVSELAARVPPPNNLLINSSLVGDTANWTMGTLTRFSDVDGTGWQSTGAGTGSTSAYASATQAVEYTLSGEIKGAAFTGGAVNVALEFWTNTARIEQVVALSLLPSESTGSWVFKQFTRTAPAGTTRFRVINVNSSTPAGSTVRIRRLKFEVGATATPWVDGQNLAQLNATVSQHTLALINLETGQALASFELVAAASGGKPARFKMVSSSLGSAIALDAPFIFWGDNTVFDDASDTLQTTIGSRIRVLALGAPFGVGGTLLEWWGPTGIALSAMTTGNGYNGRMTTAPYVFDNALSSNFAAIANTSAVGGSRQGSGVVQTEAVTVAVSGASGAVTHQWSQVGGAETWSIQSPNAASTTFSTSVSTVSQIRRATFIDRITETATGRVTTVTVGAGVFREPD
ncbi:MAG: hypothetical protein ACREEY_10050 [Brevundimonas sp.]